jgi:hypothetical protein
MEINCALSFVVPGPRPTANQAGHATDPECIGVAAVLRKLTQQGRNRLATGVVSKSKNVCNRSSVT